MQLWPGCGIFDDVMPPLLGNSLGRFFAGGVPKCLKMMFEQASDTAQFTNCGHVRLRHHWPAAKAATPEAFGNRKPGQAGLFLKLFCFAF